MKTILLFFHLFVLINVTSAHPCQSAEDTSLTMFGRGLYPGDDTTYNILKESGFTTIILSSFYIHANGDVYSGDDKVPVIHDGKYVGNKEWLRRIASLRQQPTSVKRIEILLEGRWYNQPPNTFDFIQDWTDSTKTFPSIVTGTGMNSTLYKITKVLKEELKVDAVCIDDESVYNSVSIVRYGEIADKLGLHMTLCPFRNAEYWKNIIDGSKKGLIDAVYIQCYDGGRNNAPVQWEKSLNTDIPLYPIFLIRGSFSTCTSADRHNSKTPGEIRADMTRFKKDYPRLKGGAIWQMADVKSYIISHCAVQLPESGTATTVREYLSQLRNSLKNGL